MPQNENVKHLIDVLKYAVARFPNETAIIGEGYHFTYSEFNHCIISVANELNKNRITSYNVCYTKLLRYGKTILYHLVELLMAEELESLSE